MEDFLKHLRAFSLGRLAPPLSTRLIVNNLFSAKPNDGLDTAGGSIDIQTTFPCEK